MDNLSKILELYPKATQNLKTTGVERDPWAEPEESEAEIHEELRRVLNISSWENTFENFRPMKGAHESLKAFKELASGKADWSMLLCYGKAGCGKTHLCEAVVIELLTRDLKEHPEVYPTKVRVWEWSEIIRNLKRALRMNNGSYDEAFEGYRRCSKLIIDDVGMGGADSAWAWGELEDIVNYRYRQKKFTILTTNLDLNALPERVVSRFRDAVVSRCVLNEASDYRPEKKK